MGMNSLELYWSIKHIFQLVSKKKFPILRSDGFLLDDSGHLYLSPFQEVVYKPPGMNENMQIPGPPQFS